MGTGCDRYGAYRVSIDGDAVSDVVKTWAKYGVKCESYNCVLGDWFSKDNSYSIDGKKVSHNQAMLYVAKVLGKNVDTSKYA